MKRILTVLIVTTSALFGDAACNLIEPKFEAIVIDSPSLLSSLKQLEEKAQAIYKPYGRGGVAFKIFDLSKKKKNSIEYSATNVSLLEAATSLLEQSKEDFYITRSGVIWIGFKESKIKEISDRYPVQLGDVILPMVTFENLEMSKAEDTLGMLWEEYNPWRNTDSFAWTINTGRDTKEKVNIRLRHIDVRSLVVYLDLLDETLSNQAGDDNSE